jgi:hypothetical protein
MRDLLGFWHKVLSEMMGRDVFMSQKSFTGVAFMTFIRFLEKGLFGDLLD